MNPAIFAQDANTLFVITPLRIILGIIIVLVVFFVIALRKRWIEISFESVPEDQSAPEEKGDGEVARLLPIEDHGASAGSSPDSESEAGLSETVLAMRSELERVRAEIDKIRMSLEAERTELRKIIQDLTGEYEALRKTREGSLQRRMR
jgi:hypothetical protein